MARIGFLYEGYSMHYWETFQMVLKLLLAAIPVFVPAQPYGSTQAGRFFGNRLHQHDIRGCVLRHAT